MPAEMRWIDRETLEIDGMRFIMPTDEERAYDEQSTNHAFVVMKHDWEVRGFCSMVASTAIKRIFELGIFKGGSTALYAKLFDPEKLIAVEIEPQPVAPLQRFIAEMELAARVKPIYGVDQADQLALTQIVEQEFPAQDIDLVVDDASHWYAQTRAAFAVLFPYVRPGGLYVI